MKPDGAQRMLAMPTRKQIPLAEANTTKLKIGFRYFDEEAPMHKASSGTNRATCTVSDVD